MSALTNLLSNTRGTLEQIFKIGGHTGVSLKNNSGVAQIRNAADSAFARIQVGTPTANDDAVNKLYVETMKSIVLIKGQASGAAATNTAVEGMYVITTAGTTGANTYAVGDLAYSDGTNAGDMTRYAAEIRAVAVPQALTGGTATFEADSIYLWDADGSSWVKIGDIGSLTGAIRRIRMPLTNAASQNSTFSIPASARVSRAHVQVAVAYSGGATFQAGYTGVTNALLDTTDPVNLQVVGSYVFEMDQAWDTVAHTVLATIGGAPAAGSGFLTVEFANPNV